MSISSSERGRVLIVDDDRKILDLLVDLLKLEGYEIATAGDGAEAIDLALSFNPDIVVSDVVMPIMGGLDLCRHLKEDSRTTDVPVLLISGLITSDDAGIEGLQAGADDYLDLPFRNEELLVKVARLVERHRAQKHYREIFENANDIIYTHDLNGYFTSLNRSGERITGYSREEAAKMNVADVIAPEFLSLARDMITHKANEEVATVYEIDIITKQGQRVRLEVSTRLIFRDGKPLGVQGIGRDLTERKHSEEVLRESQAFLAQQAQREAMTHRISQAIRCSLDSREIYQTAVRELGSYLDVDRCSLFMRDDRAKCATNAAEYHAIGVKPAASDFPLVHLQSVITALDKTGVLAFDDAANDPRIVDLYNNILSKANVQSIMYVAIRVGDDVPAAFALSTTRQVRQWSETDIALAKAVADQTGIAIRQAELYQKAESTSIREALVNRLTMAIRASLRLPEVLRTATVELGQALAASRVHLFLLDSEGVSAPLEHEYLAPGIRSIKHVDVDYNDLIAQRLSNSSQPLIIDGALNYEDSSTVLSDYVRAQAQRLGICSEINYPLIVKGKFRGILSIHQTDRKRLWTEDEVALVEALAERLSIGIAQAELFEMVARGKTEWETTFDAMSDGIFIFDRAGELKRVNRAGATMEAVHPRLLLGRQCCEILRTSEGDTCVVEEALESGCSVTIEITPTRLNRPLLVSVEPVLDENEQAVAVVCTARDLSDLRKVQAVARENQSLLTNILESA